MSEPKLVIKLGRGIDKGKCRSRKNDNKPTLMNVEVNSYGLIELSVWFSEIIKTASSDKRDLKQRTNNFDDR